MSKNDLLKCMVFLFFWMVVCIFVATRNIENHADSLAYSLYFQRVLDEGLVFRFEPLFSLSVFAISNITNDTVICFLLLFLLLNFFYFILWKVINDIGKISVYVLFFFLLSSSWFYVSSVNGIRQGLATPLVMIAFIKYYKGDMLKAIIWYSLSLGFHTSSILLLPFVFIIKFRLEVLIGMFFLSSLLYFFGIYEGIVKAISELIGLPVYKLISGYAGEDALWVGFQPMHVLYTMFYAAFYYSFYKFFFKNKINIRGQRQFEILLSMYLSFSISYFVFGFGAFSNRFAFFAWSLIPVMWSCIFNYISIKGKSFYYYALFSAFYFIYISRFISF